MEKAELIALLQLEPHLEGGWFRRIYTATAVIDTRRGKRAAMSSIHYLLTDDSPRGHLHRNHSDILHLWQLGGAVRYWLIDPDGNLSSVVMGPALAQGQQLQLWVPGGWWKASELCEGDFGLVAEAVCPGFDFADHEMADAQQLAQRYPLLRDMLARLCRT